MANVVHMPALSDTMEEGTLIAWHKKVGDTVESGELLAEIETDKAVMEFQSFYDGVLLYIGVEEGNAVPVDAVIAIIGEKGEDFQSLISDANTPETTVSKEEAPSAEVLETVSAPLTNNSYNNVSNGKIKASPLAKAMAKEEGIDISTIDGSGDDGRVVKRDIEDYLKKPKKIPFKKKNNVLQ